MSDHPPPARTERGAAEPRQPGKTTIEPRQPGSSLIEWDAPAPPATTDPSRIVWMLWRSRRILLAASAAGIALAVGVTALQTPQYSATARVEILASHAKVLDDIELTAPQADARALETARHRMGSRLLLARVVNELDAGELDALSRPALISRLFGLHRDATSGELRERAVWRLSRTTSVEVVRNSRVIAVTTEEASPVLAARLANALADGFIRHSTEEDRKASIAARDFLAAQVGETKARLEVAERALLDYAKREGITLTGADGSLIAQKLERLNERLAASIPDRIDAERLADQVATGDAATLPTVFFSESIAKAKLRLAELRSEYSQKRVTLKPDFPEMQRLAAQARQLEREIGEEVRAMGRSFELKHRQAVAKEKAVKAEIAELERQQGIFEEKNVQYTMLKREVDSQRTQYASLVAKLNDVGVTAELRHRSAALVDAAVPALRPFSPRLPINLAIALIGSLGLAGAGIALRELLDNRFATPRQIEGELGLPVLGTMPRTRNDIAGELADPRSALSEAYRTLRTSLRFAGSDEALRVLAVTSTQTGEGKSTTVMKLAEDFGALGRRVLVIDADLRRPRMHRLLRVPNALGLSNLLANVVARTEVMGVFRQTLVPGVTLLPAGTLAPNPADLLASPRLDKALAHLSQRYDLILLDCPPVMGLADAPIIASRVDGVLFVIAADGAARPAARASLERLRAAGARVVGVAYTRLDPARLGFEDSYVYTDALTYCDDPARPLAKAV